MRNQLTEAFGTYGTVVNVRLPTDRESGELKGIGFVEFESTEAKVGAVCVQQGCLLGSCWAVLRAALVSTCLTALLHLDAQHCACLLAARLCRTCPPACLPACTLCCTWWGPCSAGRR